METILPPSDIEAERKLIGNIFIEPMWLVHIMPELEPHMFYSDRHRYIYDAMCELSVDGDPVSPDTVARALKATKVPGVNDLLEACGGINYLYESSTGVDTEERDFWKEVVINKHQARKLIEFSEEVKKLAISSEDIAKARNKLEEKLVALSGKESSNTVNVSNAIHELDEVLQKYIDNPDAISGLETGFYRFDRALDGCRPGNVTIFYAPSSRFKSLFVTNIGWRFAQKGYKGLWFTTEMPRVQVLERLLQLESGLNIRELRRNKDLFRYTKDLKEARTRLSRLPIMFCDTSAMDVSYVRSEVNRQKRWNEIDYIIVDLVDHVYSSRFRDEMVNNQRMVMAAMKAIAKDYNIHIILVSHISKQEKALRNLADLDVEDMTGSAAKYQDVDVAVSIMPVRFDYNEQKLIGMSREEILNKLSQDKQIPVLISVTKNRHGELLRDNMMLDFNQGGRFDEMSQEDIYELTTQTPYVNMDTWKERLSQSALKRKNSIQAGFPKQD